MARKSNVLEVRPRNEKVQTGITPAKRKEIAEALSNVLTDTYLLVIKTHIYHWNVVGPLFHAIHELTEEQYNDLFAACDVIAERIRALGFTAPLAINDLLKGGNVKFPSQFPTANGMVDDLISENESLTRRIREAAESAEENGDFVTHDMLTARLTVHEKVIWMLRAIVSD